MNRTRLLLIPLCCIFAACGAPEPDGPMVCQPYSGPERECSTGQDPNVPHVTINSESMNVAPPCVRARPGTEFVVNLTPTAKNVAGAARIFPKNEAHDWLVGTNDADKDKITIPVPEELPIGDYWYGFEVNSKCVDPRVHVEH